MAMANGWKRVGKGSGPANVYLDRYEVRRDGPRWWVVFDHVTGEDVYASRCRTMAQAREVAELAALGLWGR